MTTVPPEALIAKLRKLEAWYGGKETDKALVTVGPKTPLAKALREAITALAAASPSAGGWVMVPREQLERFTALRYVDGRLNLAYSGKGRAEGRPEVVDEIWAIIHNLADAATELTTPPPPAEEVK